ncbi:hypothetical protein [Brachybacterium hainanense]|uniref:Di-and tripeptidase n=1 Tax=Brachybacterium hainanense TaxID=1541174 RepID=A0ABV6RAS4_9MICO
MNRSTPVPEIEPEAAEQEGGTVLDERWLKMIDAALKVQTPVAAAYVARLRAKHPEATDDELIASVCRKFSLLMTATGAGIGGVAALPGLGTAAAVGLTIGEGASFAEACAFLTLAVADIRGIDMKDRDTRRMVMFGVLSGDKGTRIIAKTLGKQGMQWNTVLAGSGSSIVPRLINTQISHWVRRKIAARAGKLWMARLLPFGIGAVIGGVGSRMVSRSVTDAVQEIFGAGPMIAGEAEEPSAGS